MRAELDEDLRLKCSDREEGERDVLVPALDVGQPARPVEDERMVERLEGVHDAASVDGSEC